MKEYIVWVFVLLKVWIGSTEKCEGGNGDSPINIVTNMASYREFRPFKLEGYEKYSIRKGNLKAKNTGTSLDLYGHGSDQKRPILTGGPLNVPYEFVKMSFRWGENVSGIGSEHTIDNRSYPMELQMVHKSIHDKTISDASDHEDGLAVLCFKFDFVDDRLKNNIAIDTLTWLAKEHLQSRDNPYVKKDKLPPRKDVAVVNFLPFLMDEYFHYKGSLFTGACDKAVNWIVFKMPLAAHMDNMWDLQTLLDKRGRPMVNNRRPVVPINDRLDPAHMDNMWDLQTLTIGPMVYNRMPVVPINDRPVYYHGTKLLENGQIQKEYSRTYLALEAPKNVDYLLTVPYSMLMQTATLAEWDYTESRQSMIQKMEARDNKTLAPIGEHLKSMMQKMEDMQSMIQNMDDLQSRMLKIEERENRTFAPIGENLNLFGEDDDIAVRVEATVGGVPLYFRGHAERVNSWED